MLSPILSVLKQTMHVGVFQLQIHLCNYELFETGFSNFHSQPKYH